jgi:EAL domain-containing protein (putative c-di-GMP-specific phosphodiesterase class I)
MSDLVPNPLSAESSVASAALWNWHAADDALVLRAEAGGAFAHLDGHWKLAAFLDQFDGLARPAIAGRLKEGRAGDVVDIRATLCDGRSAHVIGAFSDLGVARGLIVSGEAPAPVVNSDNNVEPVFQPIRRLSDLSVAGFEALARFWSPDGRLVGAETLVGMGGETDWLAIAPVMLRKSADMLSALRGQGRDVFMQVNLSAAEIARPLLVEEIAALIRDAGLPPGVLRVELTEQAALRDYEGALGALSAFRAAGAGIILDDFGAGHSSFAWLAELPADGVKLDPKLSRLSAQPRGRQIVTGLAALVHGLGMTVTAEGIEDRDSTDDLRAMGCDYVQGFAWDMPLRSADIGVAFDPLPA